MRGNSARVKESQVINTANTGTGHCALFLIYTYLEALIVKGNLMNAHSCLKIKKTYRKFYL